LQKSFQEKREGREESCDMTFRIQTWKFEEDSFGRGILATLGANPGNARVCHENTPTPKNESVWGNI